MKIKCNNKYYYFEESKPINEILKDEIDEETIAVVYNNKMASLDKVISDDGIAELVKTESKDGRRIYIRGLLYIMGKAFTELYPKAYLTVNYQLTNAMYCSSDNMEITQEILDNVKNRMHEIIDKNLPIKKVEMTMEEAEKFYADNETIKGKLQMEVRKDKVKLYYCEDYFNFFYGTMPLSTGIIKMFDLVKFKEGFLVEYPSITEKNVVKNNKESKKIVNAFNEYIELYKLMKINTAYNLNKKLKEGKAKELILFSEAIQENKIAEISNKIRERKNVKLVLIAGPSSSGKTTFAGKLGMALRVQGIKPVTISVDNYFVEREDNPLDEDGNYDFECIEAIDIDLFNRQLRDLLDGKEVELPTFDFTTGHKKYLGNKLKLDEDQILIIEGIHCLNDNLTNQIPKENKFKVYISDLTVLNIDYYNRISTTDTRLLRRIVRDYNFRGYSALHTLSRWPSVNKGEQKNIFPYQEEADCMFNSSIIYEISALKTYAEPLLLKIDNSKREYCEARRLLNMLKYFEPLSEKEMSMIPNNSLMREFIGGSIYE